MTADYPYFRRVGESPREARKRVTRGQRRSLEQLRIAASLEQAGRPDLAMALVDGPQGTSVLPGAQHVTVVLTRRARHNGDHRAAAVNVDTYKRFLTFEEAWGDDGKGPGAWQSGRDAGRSAVVSAQSDGHPVVVALCRAVNAR